MVFGGKFRIRRCNSKASYLPRQSLEKLSSSDPDHGSYKLTLTSNEDLVAHTKPSMLAHNGKITNNLPDVLPLGAKLQPQQPTSPTSMNGSPLRYGSNNNIANSNSPTQQQNCYPMYPAQHRYSTPSMSSYSSNNHSPHALSYARSQSFEVSTNAGQHPAKFMSQSTIDLKKTTHNLEPTLEETMLETTSKVLSPAQSENNLSSPNKCAASAKLIGSDSGKREVGTKNTDSHQDVSEGRIFRAELVNTTLSTSPCNSVSLNNNNTAKQVVTRKDSLRENIEKITQLQSKLMSAHFSDNASILSSYSPKPALAPITKYIESEEIHANKEKANHVMNGDDQQSHHSSSLDVTLIGDDAPPALPDTPPPDAEATEEANTTATTPDNSSVAFAQISQMDSTTDGLKLMQRSEIVLRVNPTTMETASQTDDLLDCDIGRLTLQQHTKEEPQRRTTLQPRQRHPIEYDCDNISKELASLLAPNDKLIEILLPQIVKSPSDYVDKLYNPDVPLRPAKRDVGTSTLMRMKTQESPERSTITVELQCADVELTNGSDSDSCDLIKNKVNDLITHLNRKIKILNKEQTTIGEEAALNDELGTCLLEKLSDKVRPIEATKFRSYIDDVGHITSLLLSLSERLARTENSLSVVDRNSKEKKTLEVKRDSLLEQLDEAKRLKEDIDRRGGNVTFVLEKNLNDDEVADFDYFINMKAKLIADARDITDQIKSGEEQLNALSEALLQSDC